MTDDITIRRIHDCLLSTFDGMTASEIAGKTNIPWARVCVGLRVMSRLGLAEWQGLRHNGALKYEALWVWAQPERVRDVQVKEGIL